MKGFAFYERKENRDVLAYLRLLVNPRTRSPSSGPWADRPGDPARSHSTGSIQFAMVHEIGLLEAAGRVGQIPEIKGKAATGLKDSTA